MTLHLTANSRLTQALKTQFALQNDASVSLTPRVQTWGQFWQSWQQQAWLRGELPLNLPRLISAFEATQYWQQLLEHHSPTALLNLADTAKQLYQAWCLWLEYQDQTPLEFVTPEGRLFDLCRQDYQAWLSQQGFIDEPLLMQQRLDWFSQGKGSCPSDVVWHGFDELTPNMKRWQSLAEQRGGQQRLAVEATQQHKPSQLYPAADSRDECQQAALFATEVLQQALANQQPLNAIRIGIVAPNLAEIKSPIAFWLDQALYQAFEDHPLLAQHSTERLYNISLGTPLSQLPYIAFLQQTLTMAAKPKQSLAYQDWSQWLTSPFQLGELAARQGLDNQLRKLQWAQISWLELPQRTEHLSWPKALIDLLAGLQAHSPTTPSMTQGQFVDWVLHCVSLLDAKLAGLSSEIYQQREKWQQTLDGFAALAALPKKQSLSTWLSQWQAYQAQTLHQAQSTWLQPIQVIGMLEAGGQRFDALWVVGLDDEAWPRPPQPNAFLPLAWQRAQACPRCDAQRELHYAQTLTQRLQASARQSVLSYARQKGEAISLPSPLIASLIETYQAHLFHDASHQAWLQRPEMQWVLQNQAPPISLGERVPGGSGILKAQSQCPLMAFFDYRLGAKYGLDGVEDGLASTDQGRILHRVLQLFWQQTRTQTALLAMDGNELEQRLTDLLNTEFSPLQAHFSASYLHQEQQRMLDLLRQWMALEQARPLGFEVVETEQEQVLTLAGIEFKISIDRIDQTEQGRLVLDYKTGQATINDLLCEPIRAPQLAVYLQAVSAPIAGLGYGLLSSDKGVNWNLLSEQPGLVAKTGKNWQKLSEKGDWQDVPWVDFIDFLQQQVNQLAQSLQQGDASMRFDKEQDLVYSPSLLALRLPEVKAQRANITDEDDLQQELD
ncbi:PD-(D/E)XK nuclease family protein [Thiomicrospira microaerophila]|uniref:PD-(D/E)XK nuclease family protein n=1 Tax=Thiomicrospira microaerophila TaxID=406020 RepID=UPI00200F27A3|nr:PD-(D/E)XK nuclease family protein [Thiomicrospira microaerophila]UQB42672.1 PD-(D/E)XK nuclease family protein [Thiomicrospira microaerophila]